MIPFRQWPSLPVTMAKTASPNSAISPSVVLMARTTGKYHHTSCGYHCPSAKVEKFAGKDAHIHHAEEVGFGQQM